MTFCLDLRSDLTFPKITVSGSSPIMQKKVTWRESEREGRKIPSQREADRVHLSEFDLI